MLLLYMLEYQTLGFPPENTPYPPYISVDSFRFKLKDSLGMNTSAPS